MYLHANQSTNGIHHPIAICSSRASNTPFKWVIIFGADNVWLNNYIQLQFPLLRSPRKKLTWQSYRHVRVSATCITSSRPMGASRIGRSAATRTRCQRPGAPRNLRAPSADWISGELHTWKHLSRLTISCFIIRTLKLPHGSSTILVRLC